MKRASSFDLKFSQDIRDPEFAQSYFTSLVDDPDEPLSVADALRLTIKQMGITDFANLVGVSPPTIHEFAHSKLSPKPETLDRFLKPFGLKTKISLVTLDKEVA